jgi:hypothetical protein
METISDVVDSIRFTPGQAGRVSVRLLRHPEPVVSLYTDSDPSLPYPCEITFDGHPVVCHRDLIWRMADVPAGRRVSVTIYPRPELQRWATKADFLSVELPDDAPPPPPAATLAGLL